MQVWLDTDLGVDDALALAWLLTQTNCELRGISTVFGNTTAQGAAANVLTVLAAAQRDLPVIVGADRPLVCAPFNIGFHMNGSDGLWGAQQAWDVSDLSTDVAAALAEAFEHDPNMLVLALGPLTNIAAALQRFPDELAGMHVVAMAGARYGGNASVVAESNAFVDPHALEFLLTQPITLDLVLLDAVNEQAWPPEQIAQVMAGFTPALHELCSYILQHYTRVSGGKCYIADLCTAVYALNPDLADAQPALVRVLVDGWARGQTLIADTYEYRLTLIVPHDRMSELLLDLENLEQALQEAQMSQPDNARIIQRFDWPRLFEQASYYR